MSEQTVLVLLIIGLTTLSALGDALGFVHAANIWREGQLVWKELAKSAFGFGFGITMYWIVIRFLQQVGVVSAEIQTILWFGVTIIGVALISRKFFAWQTIDQAIAVLVYVGIGWLLLRTGG
jgi:hypothetical protein